MDELQELQRVMHIKDSQEQMGELLKLADQGCAEAQEMIGKFYYEGSCGFGKNVKKALEYFKNAANQGKEYSKWMVWSVTSEIDTVTLYNENSYEFQNLVESADAGYTPAIAFVASAYAFGNMDITGRKNWIVEKSKSKAEHYLSKLCDEIERTGDRELAQVALVVKSELEKVDNESSIKKQAKEEKTSVSSEGCYIATAVYGDYDAPQVLTLRKFRDEVLLFHWWGKLFVKLYYSVSPYIAKRLHNAKYFNSKVKALLDRVIKILDETGNIQE